MLTPNSGVSNTAVAEAARKVLEIAVLEEMGKALAVPAAVFVKPQAFLHDLDHPVFAEKPRQLAGEPGMAAEPPAQLNPEPLPGLGDRSRGAGPDALAAVQAALRVDLLGPKQASIW